MPFVSESDRTALAQKRRKQRQSQHPNDVKKSRESRLFIKEHHHQIVTLVQEAVSKSVRKRGRVEGVKVVLLTKEKLPRGFRSVFTGYQDAEKVLLRQLKHKEPATKSVSIRLHWWNPIGNGNRRYDITVTFKPALK